MKFFPTVISIIFILFVIGLAGAENSTPEKRVETLNKGFINRCNAGSALACFRVGDSYKIGRGVEKSKKEADEWYLKGVEIFEKQCDRGSNEDCLNLAALYEVGKHVERDLERALKLYYKECNNGRKRACERLFTLNCEGVLAPDSIYLQSREPVYEY
jgi:uncharacterized protein